MRIITGGAYQGKKAYAKELFQMNDDAFIDGGTCILEEIYKAKAINQFHLWVKRLLEADKDPYEAVNLLMQKNEAITIVVNELGCGVVPYERSDRKYREVTGRICCILGKHASEVYRVTCGIGSRIK